MMDLKASLRHEFTSSELAQINENLCAELSQAPLSESNLEKIITNRANLVESLLNTLDEQHKKRFAEQELKANNAIIETIAIHRKALKVELTKVSKASKAIKQYHRV